ncbi:hypothetical protein NBRC116584_13680 [Hydrogenophaga sp. 5NK40-0174]
MARFKFQSEPGWAETFAHMIWHAPGAADLLHRASCIVPVPTSRQRLAQRGYNQSWLIAKALASRYARSGPRRIDGPVLVAGLESKRDTPAQHQLGRKQRLGNLKNAFALTQAMKAQLVTNPQARLVLIDDVSTTGTTLEAAAQALRQAGATSVSALVVCRA